MILHLHRGKMLLLFCFVFVADSWSLKFFNDSVNLNWCFQDTPTTEGGSEPAFELSYISPTSTNSSSPKGEQILLDPSTQA